MSVCLIPARGGSKRIPRKNIRLFRGKPMLAWSIEVAEASGCFDSIVVSTDDYEIADVARQCGAEVPFIRPANLSGDYTSTKDVVAHAIDVLACTQNLELPFCCLYATAPFVQAVDLQQSQSLLASSGSHTVVFPATSFPFPVQRAIWLDSDGYSHAVNSSAAESRSQDLETLFHDAGQFYLAKVSTWKTISNIFDAGRPMILPRWRVQDIDTEEDWKRAELMHAALFP